MVSAARPLRLAVVVLAGGEGRRMAGAKPDRILGGRSLLDRALERARAWSPGVGLSVRSAAQAAAPAGVALLLDDPGVPGPLAGIASALRFAAERGAEAVLTLPCDAPFLPDDLPERLAAALAPGVGVALARSGGRLHPVCALWRAGLEDQLRAYAATGRGALMGLADAVGWTAVDWPADPVDPFFNVNTPQDLRRRRLCWAASQQRTRSDGSRLLPTEAV
jgi:molybdopterin-guanine dinucleotide biosynthesis protein A